MIQDFKAVFFDVGGTLLRVHPSVGDVYARHARPYGFDGEPDALNQAFRSHWKSMGGMESLGTAKGPEVERGFWKELVRRVFEPYGLQRFDAYFDEIYDVFRSDACWRVFEDVTESGLLDRLQARGVVLGVISNWDSRLPEIIDNTGLGKYFQFVLASTVVGSAKPDIGIFQEALRLSGVQPHEACHIGDEVGTDVTGAQNAGVHPILIDRTNRFPDTQPRIQSFHELVLENV
ncbi:HAD-IA family hydrolase [Nitrospina gracilis]|uniref:HAD-IA family hydrolase n=1 Tax=Nitrospina gracilis TaxID=35801 RepID=UPI001F00647B|nr:HAD-IA family hydrolase [Nitrospina gracilis]MCF8721971.1 putative hydrolase of the HAD superfamily [Nitrospina gracilis Nb-211]